ncbi:MAG: hypothetical protein Kow0031_20700 [Anaerolineae bacterium]
MKDSTPNPGSSSGMGQLSGKIAVGLMVIAASLALAKLLNAWGRPFLGRAQNDFFDSLWLNEQRRTA